jgi:DnaD/phage-associated family protein
VGVVVAFSGFSTDGLVGLPPELFREVLPAISLPSELKVTLHVFYQLSRQRGTPRRISWDDLAHDAVLTRSLQSISRLRPASELLDEGLHAAVQRTTLLHLAQPGDGRVVNWYLVHTPANREWVAQIQHANTALTPNAPAPEQQPSLLALYEENIGLVTPLLLEELREAEARYPAQWLEDAIREAVRANARSWRYVRKVLERWGQHGRPDAKTQSERSAGINTAEYLSGPYGHLFRREHDADE